MTFVNTSMDGTIPLKIGGISMSNTKLNAVPEAISSVLERRKAIVESLVLSSTPKHIATVEVNMDMSDCEVKAMAKVGGSEAGSPIAK